MLFLDIMHTIHSPQQAYTIVSIMSQIHRVTGLKQSKRVRANKWEYLNVNRATSVYRRHLVVLVCRGGPLGCPEWPWRIASCHRSVAALQSHLWSGKSSSFLDDHASVQLFLKYLISCCYDYKYSCLAVGTVLHKRSWA